MSIESWKAEFYPVEASNVPSERAVEHSLRKWIGLRSENLAKHSVRKVTSIIHDSFGGHLTVSAMSCALCKYWYTPINNTPLDEDENDYRFRCARCPLALSREGVPCDRRLSDERSSPWHTFTHSGNPEPMIAALLKAKDYETGGQQP